MKNTIEKKVYDTEKDTPLCKRAYGEYGQSDGFEENLYITEDKQHYIHGVGGSESPYAKPTIALMSNEDVENWKKENNIE